MKRPSFQFYPGDWQANSNLRRCTHAEKGVWLDVMCLMHDQPEYGQLRWPLKEIAQAVGAPISALRGLINKGVLKGDDKDVAEAFTYTPRSGRKDGEPITLISIQAGPLWYSSRMVKDEYVRTNAGASTRFGAEGRGSQSEPTTGKPREGTDRAKLRARVFEKTGGVCYHCDTTLDDRWEIDHLMPRSKGGRHTFANLVPSCVACNQDKSDTLPDDWAALKSSPTRRHGEDQGDSPTRRHGEDQGDSPTRRHGEDQGDGSSSSSSTSVNTSPSLRSGEGAAKPQRPPGRKRSEARTLATYLAECRAAKVKPVPDDHAVRRWAADAGLTPDMLQIAWLQFRDRYTEGEKGKGKRYRDWPAHFATAVKDNWFRLWFTDDKGGMCWSSNGMTHKAVLDARAAQQEVEHEPA